MKKIFYTFIICIMVVLAAIIISGNTSIEFNLNSIFKENEPLIDETFKVNELQREKSYYFYNLLDEKEKIIYSALARGVSTLESKVDFTLGEISNEQFTTYASNAVDAFFADHPEVFYLEHKYETGIQKSLFTKKHYMKVNYTVENKQDLDTKINDLTIKIDEIVQKATHKDIFRKEIILHDELAKIAKYDYDKSDVIETHTSYGALMNKLAVCDGLTKALQLLLDRVGIETLFITGSIKEGTHAWCLVNMENNWYNIDLTSNIAIKSGTIIMHSYFNVPTKIMKDTHSFENIDKIPEAVKEDKTYYDIMDTKLSNDSTFDTDFKKILDKSRNLDIIEFKSTDIKKVENRFIAVLSNDSIYNKNIKDGKIYFYKILDTYIIENK